MSLKAKLEAVIYAAEEPVTLAQLASLFSQDAFAWKAKQEELRLESGEEAAVAEIDAIGLVAVASADAPPSGDASLDGNTARPDRTQETANAIPAEATEAATSDSADPELEARRQQRAREREVRDILRSVLDELVAEYAQDRRGIEIREIAGGFRMGTKPEMHDAVRAFVKSLKPALKLSLPALETLAVIAYKQPVTAPEVGEIRGVDSGGVLGSLMSRKLIATAGRKQVIGRPMLYKTTKEFLLRFGLKDLSELPSMEEFEKMAAMELSEESVDDESAGAADLSGDLFAGAENSSAGSQETDAPESPAAASDEVVIAEEVTAVFTPTAEPSEEAAEAQALVERLNAEEIEAEV